MTASATCDTLSCVPQKNKSEMLLEGYLRSHGYADFDFEPEIPGTTRRPDYSTLAT